MRTDTCSVKEDRGGNQTYEFDGINGVGCGVIVAVLKSVCARCAVPVCSARTGYMLSCWVVQQRYQRIALSAHSDQRPRRLVTQVRGR